MVAPALPARYTNVAHDATNSSAWCQHPFAFPPALIEFTKEFFVIFERTKLCRVRLIFFENPIGGRSNNQMHALAGNPR